MSGRLPVPFGTKAETLERLAPLLRTARVLPQVRFTVGEWRADPDARLAQVQAAGWLDAPVIVRSSALGEDAAGESLAGRYASLAGCRGVSAVRAAIDAVARSLDDPHEPDGRDQVFVQPELAVVRSSGVAFTRDPGGGGRYCVVASDDSTARTGDVTSGRGANTRTYYHHECAPDPDEPELAGVLALCRELRALLATEALDVEFAVAVDGELYLLQVRPLAVDEEGPVDADAERRALLRVRDRLAELGRPHPYAHGARAIFGSMPDWNPAEMIGARPRPLALSLYRDLITDGIWAYQRSNYGYRNLRGFPLVVSLGGLPYVDVRVSFNSFVPADLPAELGRRLVEEYIDRLLASPPDHDKVEFSIVYSCYTLDLPARLRVLADRGFDAGDRARIAASLRALTNRITSGSGALFRADVAKIAELERRQRGLAAAAELDDVSRVHWLLEDCRRFGTLPFAGIARAAFIAVQMLDSLVAVEVLTQEQRGRLLGSLRTVSAALVRDHARLSRAEFLREYGHLRPGTYDVTSPRYDEAPDDYFEWGGPAPPPGAAPEEPELDAAQRGRLDAMLAEHGLAHDHRTLLAFVRDAIEGRERAKFAFTRSLSDALSVLSRLGDRLGYSRDDLSYADVEVVRRLHASADDPRAVLDAAIRAGRARHALTRRLTLPPLITSPEDALAFRLPACEPSFVTRGSAAGPVVTAACDRERLRGGIVMIPSADPGYDWIFSRAIAGFITMYGGYNSHMAVRANELGIPAVLGAGEALFRTWSAARRLRLDCLNRRVEVLA